MADTTAVYIGKLIFENYRAFKGRNELDLIDKDGHLYQWTVFLGNNNTGKTSILKAIASMEAITSDHLYDDDDKSTIRYTPNLQYDNDLFPPGALGTLIGADILVTRIEEFSEMRLPILITDKMVSQFKLENNHPFWYLKLRERRFEPNPKLKNLKVYGYGVTRKIGTAGISQKEDRANADSLFNPDSRLTNIQEWLFQLDYASKNGQELAEVRLKLLKEIIKSEILPDIFDFRFTSSNDFENYIEYRTKSGWFKFDELGYGYQTTISWIIDLCRKMFERYSESKHPLKEPAIVLVDELDLHLHPKWQRNIVSYLSKMFPCTQFIVTTHSPLILQTIEKVNLFALVKEADNVTIRHIPVQSFEGWSVEEILAEVMEMEDGIFSDKHNKLYEEFNNALIEGDYEQAKIACDKLLGILHPDSEKRTILKLQLSQIAPVNDKA